MCAPVKKRQRTGVEFSPISEGNSFLSCTVIHMQCFCMALTTRISHYLTNDVKYFLPRGYFPFTTLFANKSIKIILYIFKYIFHFSVSLKEF